MLFLFLLVRRFVAFNALLILNNNSYFSCDGGEKNNFQFSRFPSYVVSSFLEFSNFPIYSLEN